MLSVIYVVVRHDRNHDFPMEWMNHLLPPGQVPKEIQTEVQVKRQEEIQTEVRPEKRTELRG
jgi:hypothetical protein